MLLHRLHGILFSMKQTRKRRSADSRQALKKTRFGPLVAILICVLLFSAFFAALIVFGPRLMSSALGCAPDWSWLLGATPPPTLAPTAAPVYTPDPAKNYELYSADLKQLQTEVLVEAYQYLSDASVQNGKLVFVAGNYTQDGTAAFVRIVEHDPLTGKNSYTQVPQNYKSIRYPCMGSDYIAYVDANGSGGGRIMSYNRQTGESIVLKTVHVGVPKLCMWQNYVAWVERTGSERDKLFMCNAATGESVTLAMYNNSPFALSQPTFCNGMLWWADNDGILQCLDMQTKQTKAYNTKLYVHDPKFNGQELAFISGNHGYDSDLYYFTVDDTTPRLISKGVIDFELGDGFAAFHKGDKCYVHFFKDGVTFCITTADETSLLLGAGDKWVIWMDTTWRDKDIMEFMPVKDFD